MTWPAFYRTLYRPFQSLVDDLGALHLDEVPAKRLSDGIANDVRSATPTDLSAKRDALIIAPSVSPSGAGAVPVRSR